MALTRQQLETILAHALPDERLRDWRALPDERYAIAQASGERLNVQVYPSPRRFDQWPLWRTLIWTNPLVVAAG